jgi:hypothetical protein
MEVCQAGLLAYTKFLDQGSVFLNIFIFEIIKQTAPLANQFQQPLTGMMILLVYLEMFGEILDSIGQQSDLHLG